MTRLRRHQQQLKEVCERIRDGAPIKRIVCNCGPGSGKSLMPMIAKAILPWKVAWFVPRSSLQSQAEETFQNPLLREMCGYSGPGIRKSTNDENPSRGLDGFVSTHQALAIDDGDTTTRDFQVRPYILVIDETQFVSEDAKVMRRMAVLVERCKLLILMSGTLDRHDGKEISFLNYKSVKTQTGSTKWVDLESNEETAVINYSRADGLRDKALIPLKATYIDAKAEWKRDGKTVSVESIKSLGGSKASRALFTALKTDYALQLLDECIADWSQWRAIHPNAKLLIIAPFQKDARKYCEHIRRRFPFCLAISDDCKSDQEVKKFRTTTVPIMATVGVGYIGLDCPSVTHIALLTRIRSKTWLTQCLARATRYDPNSGAWETQQATVFSPDDKKMHEIIRAIEAEQMAVITKSDFKPPAQQGERDLFGEIIPLSSAATKRKTKLILQPPIVTPSEQEADVREDIEQTVRRYAHKRGIQPHEVNGRIKQKFGKSRSEMTMDELERAKAWVNQNLR